MTDYSDADYGVKGMFNIVSKELHYEGFVFVESHYLSYILIWGSYRFIVLNHDLGNFYDDIPSAIASGELIQPIEHITKGLDDVSPALLCLHPALLDIRLTRITGRGFPRALQGRQHWKVGHLT